MRISKPADSLPRSEVGVTSSFRGVEKSVRLDKFCNSIAERKLQKWDGRHVQNGWITFLLIATTVGCGPRADRVSGESTTSERSYAMEAYEHYLARDFDSVGSMLDQDEYLTRMPEGKALKIRLSFVRRVLTNMTGSGDERVPPLDLPKSYEANHAELEQALIQSTDSFILQNLFADSCEQLATLYRTWLQIPELDRVSIATFARRVDELDAAHLEALRASLEIDDHQARQHERIANFLVERNNGVSDIGAVDHATKAISLDSSLPSPVSIICLGIWMGDMPDGSDRLNAATDALTKLKGDALMELANVLDQTEERIESMETELASRVAETISAEKLDNARQSKRQLQRTNVILKRCLRIATE